MAAQLPQRTNAASYRVVGRIVVGRNRRDKPSGAVDDNVHDHPSVAQDRAMVSLDGVAV
jgi:hypothetical protein